jgi:hypothetical protein
VRFLNRKYTLDHEERRSVLVSNPDRRGVVRWEEYPATPLDRDEFEKQPAPEARFTSLEAPLNNAKILAVLEKDFIDWAFRTIQIQVRANETLKFMAVRRSARQNSAHCAPTRHAPGAKRKPTRLKPHSKRSWQPCKTSWRVKSVS